MIADSLKNLSKYISKEDFTLVNSFLSSFNKDTQNRSHELDGRRLFASVSSYKTRTIDSALFEAHRKYIDIQVIATGQEDIGWLPIEAGLDVAEAYDEGRDLEFFKTPEGMFTLINLVPGTFAMFYPDDLHMPCLTTGDNPAEIKKVVFKLAV